MRILIMAMLAALVLAWHVWPLVLLYRVPRSENPKQGITPDVRRACALSLLKAMPKAALATAAGLLAPLVVPVALLFTRWEDNALPGLFAWFDNDVSINGDDPKYWEPGYSGDCYYAPGHHPRSRWARFVWLGWRNRASRLSQLLGHTWADPKAPTLVLGTPGASKWQEGWNVNAREGVFQLCYGKRLGRFAYEANVGHKVWHRWDGKAVSNVVNIAFAPGHWQG